MTDAANPEIHSPARRALHIAAVIWRHRLFDLLPQGPWYLRWLTAPLRRASPDGQSAGTRLRMACEDLGPVFVKFGQMLSTRRDLLPPALAQELQGLQDQVPPFDGALAHAIVSRALGERLQELTEFDLQPIASASVAQVHGARLRDGTAVVVKVLRPDIETKIRSDIGVLYTLARWFENSGDDARRLHPVAIVADYERTVLDELDLTKEASNATTLRHNFAGSELLYVPRVYPHLSHTNVMVSERVYGVPIGNIAELKRRGINFKVLAERGVETFFTQVFEQNFFHADMHPGNIFINTDEPAQPSYIAIDCAIIGSLTASDQDYLARNLLAFFNRDYASVARLHLDSGWVPADTDLAAFERVIRQVCDPIFAKPLHEISFGEFLLELFQTAREFRMEVQPQLVLLQKTLLYIEGLGRQLYPELDLWETGKPYIERWMRERASPQVALRKLMAEAPQLLAQLPELPAFISAAPGRINRIENRLLEQKNELTLLRQQSARPRRLSRAAGIGLIILGAGLLLRAQDLGDGAGAGLASTALGIWLLTRLA